MKASTSSVLAALPGETVRVQNEIPGLAVQSFYRRCLEEAYPADP